MPFLPYSRGAMKLPRAILFDNDGVLVTSEARHRAAWGRMLIELGLPYSEEEMASMAGGTATKILIKLLTKYRPGWDPADYDVEALVLRKNNYYLENLKKEGLDPYPGVRECLTWLAVVSNARRRELQFALEASRLIEFFELTISRDEAPKPKPDPAGYLHAASALGALPQEALVVEDSPPGITAGLMGGIPCAALLTSFTEAEMATPVPGRPDLKPVVIRPTVRELHAWLQQLPRA